MNLGYSDGEDILKQAQVKNENQAEAMKLASAVFLCLALKEHRQLGHQMTAEEIIQSMSEQFRAYQNRSRWDPTFSEVSDEFSRIKMNEEAIDEKEVLSYAIGFQKVALALLKSTIKLELLVQKQIQNQSLNMA